LFAMPQSYAPSAMSASSYTSLSSSGTLPLLSAAVSSGDGAVLRPKGDPALEARIASHLDSEVRKLYQRIEAEHARTVAAEIEVRTELQVNLEMRDELGQLRRDIIALQAMASEDPTTRAGEGSGSRSCETVAGMMSHGGPTDLSEMQSQAAGDRLRLSAMEAAIFDLRNELQTMREQHELQIEATKKTLTVDRLAEHSVLRGRVEALAGETNELSVRTAALQQEHSKRCNESTDLGAEVVFMRGRLEAVGLMFTDLRAKIDVIQEDQNKRSAENAAIVSRLALAEQQLISMPSSAALTLESSFTDIIGLRERLEAMEGLTNELHSRESVFQEEQRRHSTEAAAFASRLNLAEQQLASVPAAAALAQQASGSLSALSGDVSSLRLRIEDAEAALPVSIKEHDADILAAVEGLLEQRALAPLVPPPTLLTRLESVESELNKKQSWTLPVPPEEVLARIEAIEREWKPALAETTCETAHGDASSIAASELEVLRERIVVIERREQRMQHDGAAIEDLSALRPAIDVLRHGLSQLSGEFEDLRSKQSRVTEEDIQSVLRPSLTRCVDEASMGVKNAVEPHITELIEHNVKEAVVKLRAELGAEIARPIAVASADAALAALEVGLAGEVRRVAHDLAVQATDIAAVRKELEPRMSVMHGELQRVSRLVTSVATCFLQERVATKTASGVGSMVDQLRALLLGQGQDNMLRGPQQNTGTAAETYTGPPSTTCNSEPSVSTSQGVERPLPAAPFLSDISAAGLCDRAVGHPSGGTLPSETSSTGTSETLDKQLSSKVIRSISRESNERHALMDDPKMIDLTCQETSTMLKTSLVDPERGQDGAEGRIGHANTADPDEPVLSETLKASLEGLVTALNRTLSSSDNVTAQRPQQNLEHDDKLSPTLPLPCGQVDKIPHASNPSDRTNKAAHSSTVLPSCSPSPESLLRIVDDGGGSLNLASLLRESSGGRYSLKVPLARESSGGRYSLKAPVARESSGGTYSLKVPVAKGQPSMKMALTTDKQGQVSNRLEQQPQTSRSARGLSAEVQRARSPSLAHGRTFPNGVGQSNSSLLSLPRATSTTVLPGNGQSVRVSNSPSTGINPTSLSQSPRLTSDGRVSHSPSMGVRNTQVGVSIAQARANAYR